MAQPKKQNAELFCTLNREELEKSLQAKESLYTRVNELEAELSKLRKQMTELESNNTNRVAKTSDEDVRITDMNRKLGEINAH